MKSIYQMELEDKFNRKIKYREKKLKNQRMVIGKQQEVIERLNNIINEFDNWLDLALEVFNNVDIKTLELVKKKLQELKGDGSNENL